jgi:serine/threonine protein kinase/Tol biopolymer transport system component
MPVAVGQRLGPYEVQALIGAGGMGEVYKARDTRLDRTVALKILHASELHGSDRLDRFKREARAISRLNHAHICALYDIREEEGTAFLVMEYVAGETLARRLERGPLRIQDVLRYGVQVAEALDAAHRNGVIHRDLKPSNIMLAGGSVKLLDFGLAKLRDVERGGVSTATTMSLGLSEDGLIVGSLPYMAPEQLEGKSADARSDIFALGAVLYEMTTGEPPFRGRSRASLMVAILSEEPVAPMSRQPLTPALFDRTMRRCLAKAPDERWQTAADLAAELRYIGETLYDNSRVAPVPARHRMRSVVTVTAALATGVALAAAGFLALRPVGPSLPSFSQITFRRGIITAARVAPDGQTIVYSASWEGQPYDLYLTRLGSHESRSLGVPDARLFSISSSNEMAFMRGRQSVLRAFGTLARVPLAGGAPRELLENVAAADWSADGSELSVIRSVPDTSGKVQLEFPIGRKVYESSDFLGALRVSPQGDRVAIMEGNVERTIHVVDRGGKVTTLTAGWNPFFGLAWSPSGREVWFTGSRGSASALRAVSLDGKERLLAEGTDMLLIEDVFRDGRVLAARHHGREGFACRAPGEATDRDLSWFDGSGLEALSADGQAVIFGETRGGGGRTQGIYLRKTDGSAAIRLSDGYPEDLSPDGKWVLKRPTGQNHGWELLPVGVGMTKTLPPGNVTDVLEATFLPNGNGVVFGGIEQGRERRIYVQDLAGGTPRPISPEGARTIALTTPDSRFVLGSIKGHHMLFSVDGKRSWVLPFLSSEDSPLQWTPDGRFLYVLRGSPWSDAYAQVYQMMEARIDKVDVVTGQRTFWTTIKPADPVGLEAINEVFVTPDGGAYCYGFLRTLMDLFVVEGVK